MEGLDRNEIVYYMKEQEKKYFFFDPSASYLQFRRRVVDWMASAGEEFQFSSTTMHMAIKYLDRVLSKLQLSRAKLQLVAMCCLLIAAKHEEMEDYVPTLEDLNECSENTYSTELIKQMEMLILNELHWSLGVVVPRNFLKLYIQEEVAFPDDLVRGQKLNELGIRYLRKYIDFFSDLVQQDYSFQQYLPSVLAAGIIAAARRTNEFQPIWNARLQSMTDCDEKKVYDCYTHICSYYAKTFPGRNRSLSPKNVQVAAQEPQSLPGIPSSPPILGSFPSPTNLSSRSSAHRISAIPLTTEPSPPRRETVIPVLPLEIPALTVTPAVQDMSDE